MFGDADSAAFSSLVTCWPKVNWSDQSAQSCSHVVPRWLNWSFVHPGRNFALKSAFTDPELMNLFFIQVVPVYGTLTHFLWHFRAKCPDLLLAIISPRSCIIHGILLHSACTHAPLSHSRYRALSRKKSKYIPVCKRRVAVKEWTRIQTTQAHSHRACMCRWEQRWEPYPANRCRNPHRQLSVAAWSIASWRCPI